MAGLSWGFNKHPTRHYEDDNETLQFAIDLSLLNSAVPPPPPQGAWPFSTLQTPRAPIHCASSGNPSRVAGTHGAYVPDDRTSLPPEVPKHGHFSVLVRYVHPKIARHCQVRRMYGRR
jgi:hypothetical protein